ncbi:hypothetical protein AMATHDRAFT_10995 [Amanita thiersii Skay4041]|uniref:Uncharacterized protein n=1 Tax=Amanita thiersii Skay4041 TaxID=703135 RepID=A0A2A9N7J1_9AGAR|nr:hypothetical protein AMATHDRAFT_10995 [Amanita thiersii Skay4041]
MTTIQQILKHHSKMTDVGLLLTTHVEEARARGLHTSILAINISQFQHDFMQLPRILLEE